MDAEFEIAGAVADKIRAGEDVKRSPRNYDVEVSSSEIEDNINSVAAMDSVIALEGNEIGFGDGNLQTTRLVEKHIMMCLEMLN